MSPYYWFTTVEMIVTLFMFVRSIRESNFINYVNILKVMMPCIFALDHVNYSRWMTVYINDLLTHDSDLYREFVKGKSTVNKTIRKFSAMREDQAHEQHNKIIKEDGGGVGRFDNFHAILEWSLTVPYISQMLDNELDQDVQSYREDNVTFERKFVSDCDALDSAWISYNNPFAGFLHLSSKQILSQDAEISVCNAFEIGKGQYILFNKSCVSLYDTI